jgi:hypothetical protein
VAQPDLAFEHDVQRHHVPVPVRHDRHASPESEDLRHERRGVRQSRDRRQGNAAEQPLDGRLPLSRLQLGPCDGLVLLPT